MKNEEGFTLIETLCVIALFIIIAGTAGSLLYSTRRITDDTRQRTSQQFRQLRVEGLIREAVEEVAIPFWVRDEQALSIARESVVKALAEAGYEVGIEIETLIDDTGRLRGIRCRCRISGKEYEGAGIFASVPLER